MLQPRMYPRFVGQALVFEPDPFVEMADDDNPWAEGLFFILVIGLLVAGTQIVGGFLLTASMPAPDALLQAVLQTIEQAQPAGLSAVEISTLQERVRTWWPVWMGLYNYGTGWARLLLLVFTPLLLIGQWLIYGVLSHLSAKALGGVGSLNQTLGVTALAMAPRVLMLVLVVPFASVSTLLLIVWGVLVAYRGLEIAHDLSVRKAAVAAVAPVVVIALFVMAFSGFIALLLSLTGGVL